MRRPEADRSTKHECTGESDTVAPSPTRQGKLLLDEQTQTTYFAWEPDEAARAVVVLLHGFLEHVGRYGHFAKQLQQAGFVFFAYDQRGHGRAGGERVLIHRFDRLVEDLDKVLCDVQQMYPGLPIFLIGFSMGGTVAGLAAANNSDRFAGVVLSGAAIIVGGRVFPVLRRLAPLIARVFPRLRIVRMGSRFLSRDPQVVADFQQDPYVFQGRFPVRSGVEIIAAAKRLQSKAHQIRCPVLLLHGTGDLVTSWQGSRLVYERAASPDKTLITYPGLYHDLFHEPEHDQVIADVVDWLSRRAPAVR